MKMLKILSRCRREIRNSENQAMLDVAYRYYRLFFNLLVRKGAPEWFLARIDYHVTTDYKKTQRKWQQIQRKH
jgi:hypothetical protein